jgi:hypothetical protein
VLIALTLSATAARAGTWIQVSCVNPDGSAASFEGWSGGLAGNPEVGSSNGARCAPGSPMFAVLSAEAPAPQGANEYLEYDPPAGSKLAGGVVDVNMSADGGGTSSGAAVLYEPVMAYPTGVFFQCAWSLGPCGPASSPNDTSGAINLPADAGGSFFASATCGGNAGTECDAHPNTQLNAWSAVQVVWSRFLLSTLAVPQATGFNGTAMEKNVRGTGHLLFTASDPVGVGPQTGPGIYAVNVYLDGHFTWSGTPNTNNGECVPVGTDPGSGALMFDYQQPCPPTEVVSAPVPTAGLADGSHELSVQVVDAARNVSTVFDQTITTSNPQTTPNPSGRGAIHARFVISWHWQGRTTRLRSITVKGLPRSVRVTVRCTGKGCPRLAMAARSARRVTSLLRALDGRRLTTGDTLLITVTAPHRRTERIQLQIRNGRKPVARLLKR